MKRVFLHVAALALLLPCMLAFGEGNVALNVFGLSWIVLLFVMAGTPIGKRFVRSYYHEILRLESLL